LTKKIDVATMSLHREEWVMAQDSVVRARIDEKTKKQAEKVFAACGMTLSDAIRIMLTKTARDKEIPFSIHVPNSKTKKAIREAQSGKMYRAKDLEELLKRMNA
jgi:DNA-damage-inducible protein J